MARRIYRSLTPAEQAKVDKAAAAFDAEKEQIIERGRDFFTRLEAIHDVVRGLRAEREAQGLSLADMEARCGITRATLSRLENDPHPNPTLSTLVRIATALDVELTIAFSKPKRAA